MKTPLHSILWVFGGAFIGSFGSVFLKWGAGRLHRDIRTLIFNWRLAAGIALYLISTLFFLRGLKEGELSVLYPMVSVGYLFTMLWSRLFFEEQVTKRKLGGIGLILLGIAVLFSGQR